MEQGAADSYLIEISEKVLAATDPVSGGSMVGYDSRQGGPEGHRQGSAIEAQNMGIPATAIEAAVAARSISSMKTEREAAEKIFGTPKYDFPIAYGPELNKDLELALFAAKIGAYATGLRGHGRGVTRVQLVPADANDRQNLARRLASSARSSSTRSRPPSPRHPTSPT